MGGIITIIVFVLVITCEVFLFKNILVNYKDCSGFKTVLLIFFAVTAVLCAVMALSEGYSFNENTKILNEANNLSQEMILALKGDMLIEKRNITISSIAGFILILLSYIVYISIKSEWKKELNRPKKKWDFNKIK